MSKIQPFRMGSMQYVGYGAVIVIIFVFIAYATITSNIRRNNTSGINKDLKVGNYVVKVLDVYLNDNGNIILDIDRDTRSTVDVETVGKFEVKAIDQKTNKELPIDYKNGEEIKKAYIFISGLEEDTRNIKCYFHESNDLAENNKPDVVIDTKFLEIKESPKIYEPTDDFEYYKNNLADIKEYIKNKEEYEKKLKEDKENYTKYETENSKRLENLEHLWLKLDEKNKQIETVSVQAEMLDEELAPLADELEKIKNSVEGEEEYDIENKEEIYEKVLLREKQHEILTTLEQERDEISLVLEEAKKNTKETTDYLEDLKKEIEDINKYLTEGREKLLGNSSSQLALEKANKDLLKYSKIYGLNLEE